jgi:hypothetical protein
VLERPVVRRAKGWVSVGLVEAEEEGARDAVAIHDALELVVLPGHPVDVLSQMDMRVEDVGIGGKLVA